jgi:hypothetical protein
MAGNDFSTISASTTLETYRPPTVLIECSRCKRRNPDVKADLLRKKFGGKTTVLAAARALAAEGRNPCGLASAEGGTTCSVTVSEPPVWFYATLYEALHGGWRAYLVCHRHLEGLKRGRPCPGDVELDIPTLAAALGHDFKLERLPGKCECPKCHIKAIEIVWVVPKPQSPPHAPPSSAPVLRLRPTNAQLARRTMRAIAGGKL